jgi:hypothetical protein
MDQFEALVIKYYLTDELGTITIAKRLNTYKHKIRKILLKHNIKLRSYAEANKLQLKRNGHPMKGKNHSEETKKKLRGKRNVTSWNKGLTKEQDNRIKGGRPHNGPYIDNQGYLKLWVDNKAKLIHRIIYENAYGPIPENHDIHHINGLKLDNKLENLQCLSKSDHVKLHWKEGKKIPKRIKKEED